jgi:hypothetical protein
MALTEVRPDGPLSAPASAREYGSSVGKFAIKYADHLATLGALAVTLGTAAWFTRSFFYFQDDFIFLRQAQLTPMARRFWFRATCLVALSAGSSLAFLETMRRYAVGNHGPMIDFLAADGSRSRVGYRR